MQTTEKVWRNGDSLVITLRTPVKEQLGLKEGDLVNVTVEKVKKR